MGVLDSLKNIYFGLEEKYYSLLDKIDERIPIYKIIDPIDKIVPSFALVLIIGFLLLVLALWWLAGILLPPTTSTLTIVVVEEDKTPIENAAVTFSVGGEEESRERTNENGEAKLEGIEKGTEVFVEAEKEGYQTRTRSVFVSEVPSQVEEIVLELEEAAFETKTIRLVDSLGQGVPAEFTLTFSCSDPFATPPSPVNLLRSDFGVARVQVPSNCGTLRVSVIDDAGYENITSIEVIGNDFRIELSEAVKPEGTIAVNLLDEDGNPIEDSVEVQLYRYDDLVQNPEIGPIDFGYSSGGQATFVATVGQYVVKTFDSSGVYGDETSARITLSADETKTVNITLTANVIGSIKIQVIDSASRQPVDNAKVTLKYQSDERQVAQLTTDSDDDAIVEFSISRDVEYRVLVEAEAYQLGKRESLEISSAVVVVELNKCTPTTCGKLLVKVLDQDGEPVENAAVSLYNASTNYLAGYSNKVSDLNGVAEFTGVSSGNYFAFAFKETISGRSDTTYFSSTSNDDEDVDLTVSMEIPNGIVRALIVDKEGRGIAFPIVTVFDARTNEVIGSRQGEADGTFELETKADKRVYLRVRQKDSKPRMADYFTVARPVVPSTIQEFTIVMEPEIIDKDIEAEFLGLFQAGERAKTLSKGEQYTARFRLRVPEEKDYSETGMHIRVGKELIMEKDPIVLKEINAPAASIIKATKFDPDSGLSEQQYALTNDDAKWSNIVWSNEPAAGIYEVESVVEIKETASIRDELEVHWRGWAENGIRERNPEDDSVSIELYSNTHTQVFEVGVTTLCSEDFCFSARIRDQEAGLTESVSDAYTARIGNTYEFRFIITNNNPSRIHDNADLRINNVDQAVRFLEYSMVNAQTGELQGVVNGSEFPRLNVGNLSPNQDIVLTTEFVTLKPITGIISIRLVSDEAIVFEKNLTIQISAPKEMTVTVLPQRYASGIETDINVLVKDKETRLELEEAVVRLKDRRDNTIEATQTGKDGFAFLIVPAQMPGEVLTLEVRKPGYNTKEVELKIESGVLELSPDQLGVQLNVKDKPASDETFSAKNVTPFPLKITAIELNGSFKNLLDEKAINEWLEASYIDLVIKSGERREMTLKTFLSQDALVLEDRERVEGNLDIEVSNFGHKWTFNIPVVVSIGIGGEVDDPSCLILNRKEWKTSTEGQPVVIELILENNCTIGGKPVELRNLEAKVDWQGNQIGIYDVTIGDDRTELRSGYFKTLLTRLEREASVSSILTFTPFGGINGIASSEIVVQAKNPLEGADQILSNKISSEITVINLQDCISVDKELVIMNTGESAPFNVSTVNCGSPIDFELVSELELSTTEFTLADNASQTIEILSGDAITGQYPVFIKPKFASEQQEQLLRTVRARILDPGNCIELSRFEFDVYDNPNVTFDGFDTAELINNCHEKRVQVRVDMRDWLEALKGGFKWGLLTFGLSLLGNIGEKGSISGALGFGGSDSGQLAASQPYLPGDQPPWYGGAATPPAGTPPGAEYRPFNSIQYRGNTYWKDQTNGQWYDAQGKPIPNQYWGQLEQIRQQGGLEEQNEEQTGLIEFSPVAFASLYDSTEWNEIPSITGLQFFGGNSGLGGVGFLLGGVSGIMNAVIGKGNPIMQGAKGWLIGTLVEYFRQEKEVSFLTTQPDVEVKSVLLHPKTREALLGGGEPDTDVELTQEEKPVGEARIDSGIPVTPTTATSNIDIVLARDPFKPDLKVEKRGLVFTNISGFTTTEVEPEYKILRVLGLRHKYIDKVYDKDDFDVDEEKGFFNFTGSSEKINPESGELDEEDPETLRELYHLEFNSVPPETYLPPSPALLNCQDGLRTGRTGKEALPKVKFDWTWNAIDEDECDITNDDSVYCDATQFSIEVLQKANRIAEFLETNAGRLKCPSPFDLLQNTAIIPTYDIGVASVALNKNNNNVTIQAEIQNTNPAQIETEVKMEVFEAESNELKAVPCKQTISVLSKEQVACEVTGLDDGVYRTVVSITPQIDCQDCEDKTASNSLGIGFVIGETGLEECEPFSTSRLPEFLSASGITGGEADEILEAVEFQAQLIDDRYSSDFQRDFDNFSKLESFFNAPQYYTDEERGLGIYFSEPELFKFEPMFGTANPEGYKLPGAGIYNVQIDITYDDETWQLFDDKGANAKIRVKLSKADTPRPDSPFYSLPFDGTIGGDGRVGYGLNYNGEVVLVNSDIEGVRTVELPGSTPVRELTVEVSNSFKRLNTDNRGVVLQVLGGSEPKLVYSPSKATPVMLRLVNNQDEAWAFYSVEVSGGAQEVGPSMNRWVGVGFNCKGFDDRYMTEYFFEADQHGLQTSCARLEPNRIKTSYGFEFCDAVKFGDMYLKSVFFTPQEQQSLMTLTGRNDDSELITSSTAGTIVSLDGIGIAGTINSVEDIFDLVKEELVCVSTSEGKTEFWWNTKKVLETIQSQEDRAINQCILE